MNPFDFTSHYDSQLADIIDRIVRSSSITLEDSLNKLVEHLPSANIQSDYGIILKTVQPHFAIAKKTPVNKILYAIYKKAGAQVLKQCQLQWIYHNFDTEDPFAMKLIKNCFDVTEVATELVKFLKFNDYIRDLECFRFVIERSTEEHCFDVSKLPLQSCAELDEVYEILKVLAKRNSQDIVAAMQEDAKFTDRAATRTFIRELFVATKGITNPALITRKYKILLEIFNYFDESVYNESAYLDAEALEALVKSQADTSRLCIHTAQQLMVIAPYLKDKDEFVLRNLNNSMCIFDLIETFGVSAELIRENKQAFETIANASVERKMRTFKLKNIKKETLQEVLTVATGKYKIVLAAMLREQFDAGDFSLEDIDSVLRYSVRVFPIDFFLSNVFTHSAEPLFECYPAKLAELIRTDSLHRLLQKYPETKPEHITKNITEIDVLFMYLSTLTRQDIRRLAVLNTSPLLKIVYLFYLQGEMEQITVDYKVVFDFFFQPGFLKYLLRSKNNIDGFIAAVIGLIDGIPLRNTALLCGGVFDTDSFFYTPMELPHRHPMLVVLQDVLASITLDCKLEFLLCIINTLLYFPVVFSSNLNKYLKTPEGKQEMRNTFALKQGLVIDRLLGDDAKVSIQAMRKCPRKAIDIILRSIQVSNEYLSELEPSFLSNRALENAIKSICQSEQQPPRLIGGCSVIDFEDCEAGKSNEKWIVESFIEKRVQMDVIDFCYLLEKDEILWMADFRTERLAIYKPYIDVFSRKVSEIFVNMYSLCKLEGADENEVFELILQPLASQRRSLWLLLAHTLRLVNNVYICFFIERILMRYLESGGSNFLTTNHIMAVREYVKIIDNDELGLFVFAFPNLYCQQGIKRNPEIEKLVRAASETKIDGGKVSFSASNESYRLRFVYQADSLVHEANITVPVGYPQKKPRIEFKGSQKAPKFYYKLNDILGKTSKFVEVFLLWKMDIDKHLLGYTECMICYFIMDPKTRAVPEFRCEVCKNCFHDKCIYKWASESKKGQCPFCRADLPLFNS